MKRKSWRRFINEKFDSFWINSIHFSCVYRKSRKDWVAMIERDNGAISHSLTGSYKRASGCFFSVTNFGTMSRNMCNLQCPREILMDLLHQKKSFWEISTTFLTQCLVVRMLSSIFIAEIFHPFKIHLILELFSTLKPTSLEFLYELKLSFFG